MKVAMSLILEVSSFDGFASKSLVYDEVFKQLPKLTSSDGFPVGDRLVCPNDRLKFNFEISK